MRWIHRSQKSFSQSFFLILIWLYFLFHHSTQCAPKYHLADSMETVLPNSFQTKRWNSARWIHRTERNFWENFLLLFIWVYFLWPYSLQRDPKYQFSDSTKTGLANGSMKYRCNSVNWIHISQSSFSENFFLLFISVYFHCHRKLHCTQKYPIADFQKTELANWSMKKKSVTLWVAFTPHNVASQNASFQFLS